MLTVDSGRQGQLFRIEVGVDFLIEHALQSSDDKMLSSSKRGAIYLLNLAHKYWNHYFVIFLEALQSGAAVPHEFTPTNTCPTKIANNKNV